MTLDELITYCNVAGTVSKHDTIGAQWSSSNGERKQFAFECKINDCDFWIQYYVVVNTGEKVFMTGRAAHGHPVFGSASFEVWSLESLMTEIEIST